MAVQIDQGKTLIVQLTGRTESDEEGVVRLFFELNGQPRQLRIPKVSPAGTEAGGKVRSKSRRKAQEGNPLHIPAPMPGAVATVSVQVGQKVSRGNPLISIEAMKMETALTAEQDATVLEVLVAPGDRVEPKDLLIVLGESTKSQS